MLAVPVSMNAQWALSRKEISIQSILTCVQNVALAQMYAQVVQFTNKDVRIRVCVERQTKEMKRLSVRWSLLLLCVEGSVCDTGFLCIAWKVRRKWYYLLPLCHFIGIKTRHSIVQNNFVV